MVYHIKAVVNKNRTFRKIRLEEGTEAFRSAEDFFPEITDIIESNMKVDAAYAVRNTEDVPEEKLPNGIHQCAVCLFSSDDEIGRISRDMMTSGEYLKGYVLYEAAADAFFDASSRFGKSVREELEKSGKFIAGRYSPGDGKIGLESQQKILESLKTTENVKTIVNEQGMLVPERSLLYIYGLSNNKPDSECGEENQCGICENKVCQYRGVK